MWMASALLLIPVLTAGAFLLGRFLQRRQARVLQLSPVTRQHIHLFQGGQLSETAVESAKARFRHLLEEGQLDAIEASLRPGTHFVVHVRALAEIGTEDASRILERQLLRRLTDDQIEQSWYWIDLASSLRSLNREQSLPHLLRCAEEAEAMPLGHFFAAETVCFLGFAGYLRQPESPLGRAALRVLRRALEGLRSGVQPHVVAEARLGEMLEDLWDHRPEQVDPVLVRVFAEALRQVRRAPHATHLLAEQHAEQEAFGWQLSRLEALEPVLEDYLAEAPAQLCEQLREAGTREQAEILAALNDLRAETAPVVLPLLSDPKFTHAGLAGETLTWSRDPQVGPWLRSWALRHVPVSRRVEGQTWNVMRRRYAVPSGFPYRELLRALRGHASQETEIFLLAAARDWDPAYRTAALASLGWWEPIHRPHVLRCLQRARMYPHPEVRQAARAALARLGERQALQWFRQGLHSEEKAQVHEAIQLIATEGIYFLWPDLDHLADAQDADVAFHAREALECLREDLGRGKA